MSEEIDNHIIAQYKIIKKIGSGAYGHVWKVQDRKTKCLKALKKNFDAFSNSTDAQRVYRQIMFLRQLSHPNIIKLQRIMKANNNIDIYLIFQHMDVDLHTLIRQGTILQDKHKRYIIYQICKALYFLHNSDIIHRDVKPSNVLINQQCDAKLCDFGLVRLLQQPNQNQMAIMTDYIATRWYRAPELLLGCHSYSKQIDIWSLGCMIGEIVRGKPLFQGTSTINQLQKILSWSGPLSQSDLSSMKIPINQSILQILHTKKKVNKQELLATDDKKLIDLVSRTLEFQPMKRITIEQILRHPYLEEFYNEKQIAEIKKMHIKMKLHMNDNTKLSVKNYRTIIYKQIQQKKLIQHFTDARIEINLNHLHHNKHGGSSNNIVTVHPRDTSSAMITNHQHQGSIIQNRYTALKQAKVTSNKKIISNIKQRSISRKKGISLCSKQIQNYNKIQRQNSKHSRSVMGAVTMYSCSNEKYKKIINKDTRCKKNNQPSNYGILPQKKHSLNTFLSSSTKLKSTGNIL